jgi:hypothetical protein
LEAQAGELLAGKDGIDQGDYTKGDDKKQGDPGGGGHDGRQKGERHEDRSCPKQEFRVGDKHD